MDKKTKTFSLLLVAAILIVGAFVLLNGLGAFAFEFEKEKVLFVSNEAKPLELMQSFNLNDKVFVSPALFEAGKENASMSAAFNILQAVFVGNDKNTVSLWRVFGNNAELLSCRTNNGNFQNDIELSAEDCFRLLEDKNNAIVLVSMPQKNQSGKSIIVFSSNRIEITPDTADRAAKVSFVFLKTMYDNAELIINQTNQLTGLVK